MEAVVSFSRRPGPGGFRGAAVQWAARHSNIVLVAGAAVVSLALVFASGTLPRPLLAPSDCEKCEKDLAGMDPPARRAVERALMWRLIFPGDYDALVLDRGATYEVWLNTTSCRGIRGSHPGCKLYIARIPKDTLDVTVTDESGGK